MISRVTLPAAFAAVVVLVFAQTVRAADPTPSFPKQMTYSVQLIYLKQNNASFVGTHFIDAAMNRGRVDWDIEWVPNTPRQPFMLVMQGDMDRLYTVTGNAGSVGPANCSITDPYGKPVFDENWAANATYKGTAWYKGRLCNSWDGVVPYFIQGKQTVSMYYSDFFTGLPVAFSSEDNIMEYDRGSLILGAPDSTLFTNIQNMQCSPS